MAHAHQHLGADTVFKGKKLAGQRGHEHHADDRRAARAARHLHGRPAAVAEGARHQPAGRDAAGRSSSRSTSARSCSSTRPTSSISINKQDVTVAGAREPPPHHLRGAQGQDDVHRRRRRRCATATSSTSSTPPRARASRRSASSPKACGAPRALRAAAAATRRQPQVRAEKAVWSVQAAFSVVPCRSWVLGLGLGLGLKASGRRHKVRQAGPTSVR